MAEFGQILLLVLTLAWISQEVPKPSKPDATLAAAPDTLRIEQLAMPELACQDSLDLLP